MGVAIAIAIDALCASRQTYCFLIDSLAMVDVALEVDASVFNVWRYMARHMVDDVQTEAGYRQLDRSRSAQQASFVCNFYASTNFIDPNLVVHAD